jgi:CheY-like chemotaxis protein
MTPTILVVEDNPLNLELVREAERDQLLRHVQTIVPKSGAEGILEALQRLGLAPRRGLGPGSTSDPKVGSG